MKKRYGNGFDFNNASHHRIYTIWFDMKRRCYQPQNKRYYRYGGRGITVCDEWLDFQSFFDWSLANGYRDDLTIDRADTDGDYSPQNCRWVNWKTQANNKANNHYITYQGKTQTMMEWSEELNISYTTLRRRFNLGWDVKKAFNRPIGRWLNDSQ
jgi:hypothetical protein